MLDGLVTDAEAANAAQDRRVAADHAAVLVVARTTLGIQNLRSQREEGAARLSAALVACGRIASAPCQGFSSTTAAHALLRTALPSGSLDARLGLVSTSLPVPPFDRGQTSVHAAPARAMPSLTVGHCAPRSPGASCVVSSRPPPLACSAVGRGLRPHRLSEGGRPDGILRSR